MNPLFGITDRDSTLAAAEEGARKVVRHATNVVKQTAWTAATFWTLRNTCFTTATCQLQIGSYLSDHPKLVDIYKSVRTVALFHTIYPAVDALVDKAVHYCNLDKEWKKPVKVVVSSAVTLAITEQAAVMFGISRGTLTDTIQTGTSVLAALAFPYALKKAHQIVDAVNKFSIFPK